MKSSIEVIDGIRAGEYDASLRAIRVAASARESQVNVSVGRSLSVGDRVRLRNIRPRYMQGVIGTVARVMQTWIEVQLDGGVGKFSGIHPIRVHMNCVEKVEVAK